MDLPLCRRFTSLFALWMLFAAGGGEARGSGITWVGNASNAFGTAANWSGVNTPPISGDFMAFGAAGTSGLLLNNNLTTAAFNVAGFTFNTGAGAYVIGNGTTTANAGNAFTLTADVINLSSSVQTINNPFSLSGTRTFTTTAGGGSITLGGAISGSGSLAVAGGGVLALTGPNSYSGGTTIPSGAALHLGTGGAGGSITGNVSSSGTLVFNRSDNFTYGGEITGSGAVMVAGSGIATLTGASNYGSGTFINTGATLQIGDGTNSPNGTGSITGPVHSSGSVIFNRANDFTFGGVIDGIGGVTVNVGVVRLGAAQNYSGPTRLGAGVALVLQMDNALNSATVVDVATAGRLDLGAYLQSIGGLTGAGRVYSFGPSAGSLTIQAAAGQRYTFTGTLGDTDPNFSFTKSGPGTQVLAGVTSYTGATAITEGTLQSAANASLSATSQITVSAAAGLAVNFGGGSDYTLAQVAALLQPARTVFADSTAVFAFDTTNVGAGGTATYANALTRSVSLAKLGVGKLVLASASNSYTGPTTINAGTLALGVANAIPSSSSVFIASGGTLDLAAFSNSVAGLRMTGGSLTGTGVLTSASTYDLQAGTVAATLGGSVGLTKSSAGTVTMGGSHTYTGMTAITGGTLALGATNALPATTSVSLSNGTLDLGAFNASVAGVQMTGGSVTGTGALTSASDFALQAGTVSAILAGNVGLHKAGLGTVTLAGNNTYTGATTINAGTLLSTRNGTLSPNSALVANNTGTLAVNYGGASDYTEAEIAALLLPRVTFGGPTAWFGFDTANIGAGGTATFGTVMTMAGGVRKLGSGTLVLTGANSYLGGTLISAGTLQVGDGGTAGALPPGSPITNNATLAFHRSDTLTQGVDFASGISGSGQLVQQGSGTLVLVGANSFTGGTVVNAGTLQVGDGTHVTSLAGVTGNPGVIGNNGGSGGTAILATNGVVRTFGSATISAGSGGPGGNGSTGGAGFPPSGAAGGAGGAGVVLSAGAALTNHGTIIAGNGAAGGNGGTANLFGQVLGGSGGNGGPGGIGVVFLGTGVLTNAGTISGGVGGAGGAVTSPAFVNAVPGAPGAAGVGALFQGGAGTLVNQSGGIIHRGVVMGNFANSVTLETGSLINGPLNISSDPLSTLTLTGSGVQAYSAAVMGTTTFGGSLVKSGTGTWVLDQAFAYPGATTINAGTLQVTGSLANTDVTVVSGARIAGEGTIGRSLTLNDGAFLSVDPTTAAALSVGDVRLGTTLTGTVGVQLTKAPLTVGPGQAIRLLNYSGVLTGSAANVSVAGFRNGSVSTATNQINMSFDTAALTWFGNSSTWDVATTANWGAGGSEKFFTGDSVTFDDTGTVKAVVVNTPVSPAAVSFVNSAGPGYTISGTGALVANVTQSGTGTATINVPIIGGSALNKGGPGTLTLTANNTYSGATTISDGTLQLGNGGATGSLLPGSVITNHGKLVFNRANTVIQGVDFAGTISGGGSLEHQGSGTLILTGTNTFASDTTVAAGATLQLGTGGATGSVAGNIRNSGTVVFNRGGDYTYPGLISRPGGVTHNGAILRFAQRQDYGGPTVINSGILVLTTAGAGGLNSSTVVTVATGAALDLSHQAQTFAGLNGGGAVYSFQSNSSTLTLEIAAGQTHTFFGNLGESAPNFGLTKDGPGTQVLSGTNAYTRTTTVNGGTLEVDGSVTASSGVSVSVGGTLSGHGLVRQLSGGGLVSPGGGAILTGVNGNPNGVNVDPSGGLDFAFKFALAGMPNYSAPAASGNDLLHLTNTSPFAFALTPANVITVDFSGSTLMEGQIYQGGFFLNAAVPASMLSGASFSFAGMNGLAAQYDGLVTVTSAAFATGTVANGQVMQFTIVPEPGSASLAALGALALSLRRWRRGMCSARRYSPASDRGEFPLSMCPETAWRLRWPSGSCGLTPAVPVISPAAAEAEERE